MAVADMPNSAGYPVPLPATASERRLAEAAKRPLPVIGPTARILLLCARETLDAEQSEKVRLLCAKIDDWRWFVSQAEFRLIVPLVYRHLSSFNEPVAPPSAMADLRERARRAVLSNLAMVEVHHRLVRDILEPLSAPYLFFKGPSFAYRYYRNPELRQCRDIDLLVPRRHLARVGRHLLSAGFTLCAPSRCASDDGLLFLQRFSGMMNWLSPEGVLVEIPSSLDAEWGRLPTEELITQSEMTQIGNLGVPVLSTGDFFCYMCNHHSRHHWARLHWLADLNVLITSTQIRARDMLQHAHVRGFERTVAAGLSLQKAFALNEPWKARIEDPFAHELLRHCLTNLEGSFDQELCLRDSFPATSFDKGAARRRWRSWIVSNWSRFRPRTEDFSARPMPARWHWIYYLLRPFMFVSRKFRTLYSRQS